MSYQDAEDWREKAKKRLLELRIGYYDPVRSGEIEPKDWQRIWQCNIKDIDVSDFCIFLLNPKVRSIGSIREIEYAMLNGIHCYVVDSHLYENRICSVWDWDIYPDLDSVLQKVEEDFGPRKRSSQENPKNSGK